MNIKLQKPEFTESEKKAIERFHKGEKWSVSEFIDEDTIIAGYGKIDNSHDFEFPLPTIYIKQIYGTTTWSKFLKRGKNFNAAEMKNLIKHILENKLEGIAIDKFLTKTLSQVI